MESGHDTGRVIVLWSHISLSSTLFIMSIEILNQLHKNTLLHSLQLNMILMHVMIIYVLPTSTVVYIVLDMANLIQIAIWLQ